MRITQENFDLQQVSKFMDFCRQNNQNINYSRSNQDNNTIERFKKGYKIQIKKQNRGKFTKYCNGKVTNECIQRGKNSPDPKIRKRATFAANARKFKH